jgi:hypothetical protein
MPGLKGRLDTLEGILNLTGNIPVSRDPHPESRNPCAPWSSNLTREAWPVLPLGAQTEGMRWGTGCSLFPILNRVRRQTGREGALTGYLCPSPLKQVMGHFLYFLAIMM